MLASYYSTDNIVNLESLGGRDERVILDLGKANKQRNTATTTSAVDDRLLSSENLASRRPSWIKPQAN